MTNGSGGLPGENLHANRPANLPSIAAVTSYVTMKTLPSPTT
jgi:hypothetical protein